MDALIERLDVKLREWEPTMAADVKVRVAEIIDWADAGGLDIGRSRAAEQEVLDILDHPANR